MKTARVLQHVPFEGPGQISPWLARAGFRVETTRWFESDPPPRPDAVDVLVVMGGPMSVHDEARFPWLAPEKAFLRDYLQTGRPVLGICLGAQLLAEALGAQVIPGREKEIGWFPIEGLIPPLPSRPPCSARSRPPCAAGEPSPASGDPEPPEYPVPFRFPALVEVFHWHGETFGLPPGAVHLARSTACENQAFQLDSAIGLQFHLESTPATVRALVDHCGDELVPGPFVQSAAALLAAPPAKYEALHRLLDALLAHLLA